MSITSDEVNFLVYRYLQESGKSRLVVIPVPVTCALIVMCVVTCSGSNLYICVCV